MNDVADLNFDDPINTMGIDEHNKIVIKLERICELLESINNCTYAISQLSEALMAKSKDKPKKAVKKTAKKAKK